MANEILRRKFMKNFLKNVVTGFATFLVAASAFADGMLLVRSESPAGIKELNITESGGQYNGTFVDTNGFQQLVHVYRPSSVSLVIEIDFVPYPLSTVSGVDAKRQTFMTYSGTLPGGRALNFTSTQKQWGLGFDGTVGTITDLDGSRKSQKFTMSWGKTRLLLDKDPTVAGGCTGEITRDVGTNESLVCVTSGTMTDALFGSSDHVVPWIINFFVK
jgi:hypothetical protein